MTPKTSRSDFKSVNQTFVTSDQLKTNYFLVELFAATTKNNL